MNLKLYLRLILGVDDMFVIIQCMDNLDDALDPKEKVAQVSRKKYVQFIHCEKTKLSIYMHFDKQYCD